MKQYTINTFSSNAPAGSYRRGLELGNHYASAMQSVRANGLDDAVAFAKTLGGMRQPTQYARKLLAAIDRANDLSPLKYVTMGNQRMMLILQVSWRWAGDKQVPDICYLPYRGANIVERMS